MIPFFPAEFDQTSELSPITDSSDDLSNSTQLPPFTYPSLFYNAFHHEEHNPLQLTSWSQQSQSQPQQQPQQQQQQQQQQQALLEENSSTFNVKSEAFAVFPSHELPLVLPPLAPHVDQFSPSSSSSSSSSSPSSSSSMSPSSPPPLPVSASEEKEVKPITNRKRALDNKSNKDNVDQENGKKGKKTREKKVKMSPEEKARIRRARKAEVSRAGRIKKKRELQSLQDRVALLEQQLKAAQSTSPQRSSLSVSEAVKILQQHLLAPLHLPLTTPPSPSLLQLQQEQDQLLRGLNVMESQLAKHLEKRERIGSN